MIDRLIEETYQIRKNLGINKELIPPYDISIYDSKLLSIMNQLLKLQQDIKNDIGSRLITETYSELLIQVLELKEIISKAFMVTDSVDKQLEEKVLYAFSNVAYQNQSLTPPSRYINK
jgi:hypothetical protein